MTDLISRQEAIDEIGEWIKAFLENGHKESAADARLIQDGIIQLPSAQPEKRTDKRTETHTCDSISRQAAIDHLRSIIDATDTKDRYNVGFTDGLEFCISHVAMMPSAQPERKPGHWEIYIISMLDGEGCRCSECGFEGAPYWDFCPNCGADMRKKQR